MTPTETATTLDLGVAFLAPLVTEFVQRWWPHKRFRQRSLQSISLLVCAGLALAWAGIQPGPADWPTIVPGLTLGMLTASAIIRLRGSRKAKPPASDPTPHP